MSLSFDRRQFLGTSAAVALGACSGSLLAAEKKRPKLRIAVKYAMIDIDGDERAKLELVKKLGFQGVEINSPSDVNLPALKAACEATGIVMHGSIDSVHWTDTLSDPDPVVRARGLEGLKTAIRDAHFFGAETALLVPGVVKDGVTYQECFDRSQAEVKKALPLAEELKVKIAIETVWNNFITSPEQMIDYVDAFQSPWVAAYFDCSNMLKYKVPSETWIRKLGKRLVKFDFKGYHMQNSWCKIGEGSENWPEVLTALAEIEYDGWATSEVGGGGEDALKDIADRMKKVLELA